MRNGILALAAAVLTMASASSAQAFGGPFSVLRPQHQSASAGHPVLPVFQAAPWYLYWPYDGHFMTPAPLPSGFMPPPGYGGGYGYQPYFPAAPMNQYPGTPMNIVPR